MSSSTDARPHPVAELRLPISGHRATHVRCYGELSALAPVLVWVHGGSWAHGSVEAWHDAYSALRRQLPVTLVALRYSPSFLAPFPAALTDVAEALRSVRDQVRAAPLLAGGDSSGASLVAHAAARDPGIVDAQLLAYPPIDPWCASTTYDHTSEFPSRTRMRAAWMAYAGGDDEQRLQAASPLAAPVAAEVAPASLLVGAADPVRGDVELHAERLRRAGVPTRLTVSPAVGHGDFLRPGPNRVHDWVAAETRYHLTSGDNS